MRKRKYTEEEVQELSDSYLQGFHILVEEPKDAEELLSELQDFTGVYGEIIEKHQLTFVKTT
jgi:hypothetical protein